MTEEKRPEKYLIHLLSTAHKQNVKIRLEILKIRMIAEEIKDTDGVYEREYNRADKILNICNSMGVG